MRTPVPPPESVVLPAGLAAVQHMMAHAIMAPMGPRQRMRREHAGVASILIKPNAPLSSLSRLEIYHQQYWWRLKSALMEDFPGLRSILGARRFDRLVDEYLASHGSTSWNLRDLGQHLAAFLRARPDLLGTHEVLALDMARVEWARVIAFDGARRPPFDASRLTTVRIDRLRMDVQPFVTLAAVSYPVDKMLGRLRQGKTRLRFVRPSRQKIYLAIHRQEFAVYYQRLEPGAFFLLTALRGQVSLAAACADALNKSGDTASKFAANVERWFANWMQLGWLCNASE